MCQQWTKEVSNFTPNPLSFPGLITQPDQVAPLLDGEDETLLVGLEQKANPEEALVQLSQQLEAYKKAAEAWTEFKQKAYAYRDILAAKIQEELEAEKAAGAKSLEDLTNQVETAIAAQRAETDAKLAAAGEDYNQLRETRQAELERAQEKYKEKPDNYWRDQIKSLEKNLSEIDKARAKKEQEIESAFRDFERQQRAKVEALKAELAKRLAAFESRLSRLDSAMAGFGKGYERRMEAYAQQPERVLALLWKINERCAKAHNAVFTLPVSGDAESASAPIPGGRALSGQSAACLRPESAFKPVSKRLRTKHSGKCCPAVNWLSDLSLPICWHSQISCCQGRPDQPY